MREEHYKIQVFSDMTPYRMVNN